jgi:sec-independent protein translocase protein TatC
VEILKKDDDKKTSAKKKSVARKDAGKDTNRKDTKKKNDLQNIKKKKSQPLVEAENNPTLGEAVDDSSANKGVMGFIGSIDLIGYLDRFRSKFIVTAILFVIIMPTAFYFSDILLDYINKPFIATGNKLNIFSMMGGFMLKLKISAAASFFVLIPLIIYQVWSIFSPSMPGRSKLFSGIVVTISILLFYGGVAFTFFFFLPEAIDIMIEFIHESFKTTIGADNYLGFIIFFSIMMGVFFETPVVIYLLTRMGIITPETLSKKRKYAILIIWIIAAVITPQVDPFSQALVAVPLMIIYEISIIISKLVVRRKKKEPQGAQG